MEFVGICLVTRNVPALARFYAQVLWVQAEGDEIHVDFQTAGARLSIFSADEMEQMAPNSMRGVGYGSVTIGFGVADVDAEYERLKHLGVELVKLPASYPWGSRSVWFRDLDGNIIDFFAPLTK
jgi:predicted enzyme related to lactoylglutathione lyase